VDGVRDIPDHERLRFVCADVCDTADLGPHLRGTDAVVLAAIAGDPLASEVRASRGQSMWTPREAHSGMPTRA
jgi:hypothetical protein